jgi:hypothetical protein
MRWERRARWPLPLVQREELGPIQLLLHALERVHRHQHGPGARVDLPVLVAPLDEPQQRRLVQVRNERRVGLRRGAILRVGIEEHGGARQQLLLASLSQLHPPHVCPTGGIRKHTSKYKRHLVLALLKHLQRIVKLGELGRALEPADGLSRDPDVARGVHGCLVGVHSV